MKGQCEYCLPADFMQSPDIIFAIGDIHGWHRSLASILEILLPLPNRAVFLGDYVDRGPSSISVVDHLVVAKAARPDWVFILGNHELMLRDNIRMNIAPIGDRTAYAEYKAVGGIPESHQQFFDSLILYHESEKFLFVHGGIGSHPHIPIDQRTVDELCWTEVIDPEWKGKIIVRGHVELEEPQQFPNYIGCCTRSEPSVAILDDRSGQLVGSFNCGHPVRANAQKKVKSRNKKSKDEPQP